MTFMPASGVLCVKPIWNKHIISGLQEKCEIRLSMLKDKNKKMSAMASSKIYVSNVFGVQIQLSFLKYFWRILFNWKAFIV